MQAGRGAGVALENYKKRELNRPCTALCAEAVLIGRGEAARDESSPRRSDSRGRWGLRWLGAGEGWVGGLQAGSGAY